MNRCWTPAPEQPQLSLSEGVLCCGRCRAGAGDGPFLPLEGGTLEAMRHIVYGDPKRLFSVPADGAALACLAEVCERFLTGQLDRGFQTLDFYKQLKAGM